MGPEQTAKGVDGWRVSQLTAAALICVFLHDFISFYKGKKNGLVGASRTHTQDPSLLEFL